MKALHRFSTVILVCFLHVLTHQTSAEEVSPPVPKAPFVASPPTAGSWIIKVSIKNLAPAESAPQPVSQNSSASAVSHVECVKTGTIKRDVVIYSDGRKNEVWYFGNFFFQRYANSDKIAVLDTTLLNATSENRTGDLLLSSGFPALSWVRLENYKGVAKISGKPCFHYALPPSPPTMLLGTDGIPYQVVPTDGIEAWIDVETSLPVAVTYQGANYIYKFGEPPSTPLQLPPAQAGALAEAKRLLGSQ